MANVIINDSNLTAIGNAIRAKNGTETLYKPREMAAAIEAIEVGGGGSGDSGNDAVRQSYVDWMAGTRDATITIPKEAVSIPPYFCYTNERVKHVVLENHSAPNCTTIDNNAFGSSKLESIEWPENLIGVGSNAFSRASLFSATELPETLTAVGISAFRNTLVSFSKWPASIKRMENYIFAECPNLQITSLPEGVEYIGNNVFQSACDSSVTRELFTIPSTVTSVGNYAFQYQNFKKIRFMGTPSTISGTAFSNSDVTDLYVPWTHSGVVANSPYGAINATIHYNTAPEDVIE